MKKIFVIDWWLIALFLVTAISGFGMHISGSRYSHDIWHNWAVAHIGKRRIPRRRNNAYTDPLGLV